MYAVTTENTAATIIETVSTIFAVRSSSCPSLTSLSPTKTWINSFGETINDAQKKELNDTEGIDAKAPFEYEYGSGQSLIMVSNTKLSFSKDFANAANLLFDLASPVANPEKRYLKTRKDVTDPNNVAEASSGQPPGNPYIIPQRVAKVEYPMNGGKEMTVIRKTMRRAPPDISFHDFENATSISKTWPR